MHEMLYKIKKHTHFFFVRHAQTEHNATRLIAGREETILTEEGKTQALATSKFFNNMDINYLLHSPLKRTKQTADYMSSHLSVSSVQECQELIEIDTGEFSGKTLVEIQEQEPEKYYQFRQKSWEAVAGAETIQSLLARCNSLWNTLVELANNTDQGTSKETPVNIIAITHGGLLQWIFKTAYGTKGLHAQTWAPLIRTSNCGIYELIVEPLYTPDESHIGAHAIWNVLNHTCYN